MAAWQKSLIIGSVAGAMAIGGLVASKIVSIPTSSNLTQNSPAPTPTTTPTSVSTPTPTPSATPIYTSTPISTRTDTSYPTSTPTPITSPIDTPTPISIPSPTSSLSQEEARDLIARWQTAKRTIFAPPYDRQLGAELTTGQAYQNNIQGPSSDGDVSSREWLQQHNSYYQYGVQRIDSIERFEPSGDRAAIEVVVTEQRTLYNRKGNIDPDNTSLDTLLVRYNLELDNGKWKISSYKTIRVIQKS
jgi:serine/threonine-protein kinase